MIRETIREFNEGRDCLILQAECIGDLARDRRTQEEARQRMARPNSFYGHEVYGSAVKKTIEGDTASVAEVDKLMGKFSLEAHTIRVRNVADIIGGSPIVPAILAGHPLSMLHRKRVREESAPLNIYASLTSSGGIDYRQLIVRGAAILSLVMRLIESRPVNLVLYSELSGRGNDIYLTVPVNTRPLDIATAAYAMASSGFSRGLCYSAQHSRGAGGSWPSRYNKGGYSEFLRELFQLGPDDLLIESAHINAFNDPEAWVKEQLAKYQPHEV